MKKLQIVVWAGFFSLVVAVSLSFGHCGKNHKHVEGMTSAQLQQQLVEADITSEALMFKRMLREKEMKEKSKKDKNLDELFNKLMKDK